MKNFLKNDSITKRVFHFSKNVLQLRCFLINLISNFRTPLPLDRTPLLQFTLHIFDSGLPLQIKEYQGIEKTIRENIVCTPQRYLGG